MVLAVHPSHRFAALEGVEVARARRRDVRGLRRRPVDPPRHRPVPAASRRAGGGRARVRQHREHQAGRRDPVRGGDPARADRWRARSRPARSWPSGSIAGSDAPADPAPGDHPPAQPPARPDRVAVPELLTCEATDADRRRCRGRATIRGADRAPRRPVRPTATPHRTSSESDPGSANRTDPSKFLAGLSPWFAPRRIGHHEFRFTATPGPLRPRERARQLRRRLRGRPQGAEVAPAGPRRPDGADATSTIAAPAAARTTPATARGILIQIPHEFLVERCRAAGDRPARARRVRRRGVLRLARSRRSRRFGKAALRADRRRGRADVPRLAAAEDRQRVAGRRRRGRRAGDVPRPRRPRADDRPTPTPSSASSTSSASGSRPRSRSRASTTTSSSTSRASRAGRWSTRGCSRPTSSAPTSPTTSTTSGWSAPCACSTRGSAPTRSRAGSWPTPTG